MRGPKASRVLRIPALDAHRLAPLTSRDRQNDPWYANGRIDSRVSRRSGADMEYHAAVSDRHFRQIPYGNSDRMTRISAQRAIAFPRSRPWLSGDRLRTRNPLSRQWQPNLTIVWNPSVVRARITERNYPPDKPVDNSNPFVQFCIVRYKMGKPPNVGLSHLKFLKREMKTQGERNGVSRRPFGSFEGSARCLRPKCDNPTGYCYLKRKHEEECGHFRHPKLPSFHCQKF